MPVISNNSTSSLPFFVENQILRANDLNALVQGLMEQLRQNRTYNIGIGIVNGLNVTVEDSRHIKVTTGFGISSDGYTFETNECVFTYIRSAESLTQCKVSSSDCEEYRELIENMGLAYELTAFDESDPNSSPDEINTGGWQEIEEFPITATDNTITIDDVEIDQGFCLLFIWCEEEVARTSCFNDCEQKGADQNASLKVVLFPRKKYEEIYGNTAGEEALATEVILPAVPRLPRFGFDGDHCIQLCEIEDWNDFYNEYQELCKNIIEDSNNPNNANNPTDILGLYNAAYLRFYEQAANAATNPFDGLELFLKNNLIDQKYTPNAVQECLDIQYLYTYLQELLLAYEEFRAIANGMTLLGNSNDSGSDISCLFPKHISLGAFTAPEDRVDENQVASTGPIIPIEPASAGDPPVCRSDRRLPDVFPQTLERKEKALALFERMVAMVKEVNVLLPTSEYDQLSYIGLTPDIRRFPYLNSKAIPFYYNNLTNLWRSPEALYPSVFQYLDRNSDHILFSEVEPYDFYRIEGHLGRSLEDVLNKIEDHKSCFNIAFDVRAVRIGPGNAIPPDMELEIKDLEIAFQNTRNGLINQLEVAEQHELMEGSLADITELLEYVYVSFTTLGAITSPYDDLQIDCCSGSLPTIPAEYLEDFTALFDGRLSIDGKALDETIGNCIRDLAIEYHQRVLQYEQALRFSCFAQAHPGLEHLGGVPRGGTFVIVYKELLDDNGNPIVGQDELPIKTVVADFCLPYLCCSEGVIIRNEIRKINNELVIPKVVFCFDVENETNDSVVVQAQPPRGILTVSYEGGNDIVFDDFQTDNDSPIPLNSLIAPNDQGAYPFINGEMVVAFTYDIGGIVETKTITVYKTPVVNCEKVEDKIFYESVEEDGSEVPCRYAGRICQIDLIPPLPLNEIDSLVLEEAFGNDIIIISATGLNQEAIDASEIDNLIINDNNQLERLSIRSTFGERTIKLSAQNHNCNDDCSVLIPSYCPTELSIENIYTYAFSQDGDTAAFAETRHETNEVPLEIPFGIEDTGFIAVRVIPPGFNLTGKLRVINDNEDIAVDIPEKNIIRKDIADDPMDDCETNNRYFIIYDLKQAISTLDTFAELSNFPLKLSDLEEVEALTSRDPGQSLYSIDLTYILSNGYENCELNQTDLAIPIIEPSQPKPADDNGGTSDNEESGNDGSTDDTNSDTDDTITDNTTTDNTDNNTDTTGTRGIAAALVSPTSGQLSAAAGQLLNQRQVVYINQLDTAKTLEEKYAGLVSSFIRTTAGEEALMLQYQTIANAIFKSYRSLKNKERKSAQAKIIVNLHHALLDKLLAQPEKLSSKTINILKAQMKKTAAAGISLTKIKRGWKVSALRKVFDKTSVNILNDTIKA